MRRWPDTRTPWPGDRSDLRGSGDQRRERLGSASRIRHDAQGRGTATVRCPDGVVDRPAWTQRAPWRTPWPNSMLLAWRSLFRPTSDRQHDTDGPCDDPDGVRLRRAGTGDYSQQDRVREPKIEDAIRRHLSFGGCLRLTGNLVSNHRKHAEAAIDGPNDATN